MECYTLTTDDSPFSGILWDGSFPCSAKSEGEKGLFLLPVLTVSQHNVHQNSPYSTDFLNQTSLMEELKKSHFQ